MKIDRLFMDEQVIECDETDYLVSKLSLSPERVTGSHEVFKYINSAPDPVLCGKKTLYITKNNGAVIKECPGTTNYTCCDYTILHTGTFCNMDCSYCILQAYFHPPVLQYYVGFDLIQASLQKRFENKKIYRIGTGEYTDSLIWEKISLLPQSLVKTFAQQDNCLLELKTKTVNIDSLLPLEHNGKTVIAWSLNTPDIIASEEKGTASLKARLKAAKKAQDVGFKIAFHFDPVVIYPGCENAYKDVIRSIFEYVDPANIVWISIGTFRFMPKLKSIIEQRFKTSTICYGEFILGLDNKMRYFKPLRIKIYKEMIQCIKDHAPNLLVYFCMEDEEVWNKCLGFFPKEDGALGSLLDQSAVQHCNLNSELL